MLGLTLFYLLEYFRSFKLVKRLANHLLELCLRIPYCLLILILKSLKVL